MSTHTSPPPAYYEKAPVKTHQDPSSEQPPTTSEKELDEPPSPTSSTSSTALDETHPTTFAALTGPQLTFHHASFPWRSVNVTSATTGTPLYYAEISEATPSKPDILLRSPDKNGAGVGRSHFRLSRSMRCGVGRDDLDCAWTEMASSAVWKKGVYEFVWEGRRYRLQRTRARENGVSGMQRANWSHFKVVDVGAEGGEKGEGEEGEVVAVYVSDTYHPARMKGRLTLKEGVGKELEVLIVLGVVGWREKMRRRAAYSSHGGGGG